jgi:hypothetical protein
LLECHSERVSTLSDLLSNGFHGDSPAERCCGVVGGRFFLACASVLREEWEKLLAGASVWWGLWVLSR